MKYFSFLVLFLSCQSNSANQFSNGLADSRDTTVSKITMPKDSIPKKMTPLFNNKLPFNIITVVDTLNMHTTDTDASKCSSWKLDKVVIKKIIQHAEPIDGTTWDLAFSVLKCSKLVFVKQHEQPYTIEINAGGYFSVKNADSTILFGDFNRADRKYFLDGPYNDEENN